MHYFFYISGAHEVGGEAQYKKKCCGPRVNRREISSNAERSVSAKCATIWIMGNRGNHDPTVHSHSGAPHNTRESRITIPGHLAHGSVD